MSIRHKGLMVILDGLGDRPTSKLAGKTPLEAALTPNLDRLASAGMCGMVDPLKPGIPVATHTGTGLMLGLAPRDAIYLPRGPVEAAGAGLPIASGDIAIRCNFATLEPAGEALQVIDRRAGRIQEGTTELATLLQEISLGDGIIATLKPSTQHRAVLRISGPNLSGAITDTDPGDDPQSKKVLPSRPFSDSDPAATRTADALNRFIHEAYQRLQGHPINKQRLQRGEHPANGIITRGAGMLGETHSLVSHLGLKSALVAAEGSVIGLGRLLNYNVITDPHFTALPDTDLEAKITAATHALESHDLVFLHIKAPDICAHDFSPEAKKSFLEHFDQAIATLLQDELAIGISGDHSTDSTIGDHCGDPVPSILYMPGGRKDDCHTFGETTCLKGGLSRLSATDFILSLLDGMGAMHSFKPSDDIFFGI